MHCFVVWLTVFSFGIRETDQQFQEHFQSIGKNNKLRQFLKSVTKFHIGCEKKMHLSDIMRLFFPPLNKYLILLSVVYLWIPEHSMQSSTPRLMEAQQGAACPQSQHSSLPGRLCTLWRRLSPPPLTPLSALSPLSLGSLAESMLLVEGEAVRSRRCRDSSTDQIQ